MNGEQTRTDGSQPFSFVVDSAFVVRGRRTVVCGTIQSGVVSVNDYLELHRGSDIERFRCTGLELVNKRPVVPGLMALRLVTQNGEPVSPDSFAAGDLLRSSAHIGGTLRWS